MGRKFLNFVILSVQTVNTVRISFSWLGYQSRTHTWWSAEKDIVKSRNAVFPSALKGLPSLSAVQTAERGSSPVHTVVYGISPLMRALPDQLGKS